MSTGFELRSHILLCVALSVSTVSEVTSFSVACESYGKKSTMGDGEKLSRKMIFPYTYTAKIVQFPFKLHMKHHWMFPWFVGATILVSPVFYQIQKFANCEANVKIWAEKRRKDEEHAKHKWD